MTNLQKNNKIFVLKNAVTWHDFRRESKHLNVCVLTVILLLISGWQAQAQTDMSERLLQIEQEIAAGNLTDSVTFAKYDTLVNFYAQRDVEKFRLYYPKAIAFAKEKKNELWEASYLRRTAVHLFGLGETDSILIFLDKSLQLIEGKDNWVEESANFETRGYYYNRTNEHEKAIVEFQKSLDIIIKDKNKQIDKKQDIRRHLQSEATLYNHFATLYYKLLNFEKTVEYLLLAVKLIEENRNDNLLRYESMFVRNLAQVYMEMGQGEKALTMLQKSYELASASEDFTTLVYVLQSLSNYFRTEQKDFNRSLNYAKEALKIAEQTQQPLLLNQADDPMFEICYAMKDYRTALFHAERMLERTPEDDWEGLRNVYSGLIRLHAALGNTDKTEDFFAKYNDLMSKISDKNLHESLQEMEVKYDVQQKEFEIERQQSEISRHKTRQNMLVGGLAVAALLLVLLIYIVRLRNRRNRELTETNTTKDKFFSIISHDLKNPAIAQRDALQLLLDNSEKWSAGDLSNYYQKLLKSADGQVDLLYNLLNWAQVQTGRMPYIPAQFDLTAALQSDIGLVRAMAERKGLQFDVQTPEAALVTGDDNMLVTVVRNLLTNAVKFTASGGTVTLEIAMVQANPAHTIVSVADTGTGMMPEQMQNLFRIDRQRSRKGTFGEQGSGLGLIVCKELIEKHGSRLHVESENGKGSRFWFTI